MWLLRHPPFDFSWKKTKHKIPKWTLGFVLFQSLLYAKPSEISNHHLNSTGNGKQKGERKNSPRLRKCNTYPTRLFRSPSVRLYVLVRSIIDSSSVPRSVSRVSCSVYQSSSLSIIIIYPPQPIAHTPPSIIERLFFVDYSWFWSPITFWFSLLSLSLFVSFYPPHPIAIFPIQSTYQSNPHPHPLANPHPIPSRNVSLTKKWPMTTYFLLSLSLSLSCVFLNEKISVHNLFVLPSPHPLSWS